ncbi:MAG: HD domain-containing protein [Candidatus Pacebacteria bacterium]|nr:HD domain-containing protein [Candidatus Paceibacterota bacterium]
MQDKIPQYVIEVILKLEANGFEAFVVGGCVRDLLLGKEPKDWDVATLAKPDEIVDIFPDSVYENEFGTVGIKIKEGEETIDMVEITTYRIESKYTDKRHPDEVKFAKTLEEDLSRRDFTINSLALKLQKKSEYAIVDLFSGQGDLKNKIIRAVGKADDRFNEDALRMMRAIRFAVQLNFSIEEKTLEAIRKNAKNLKYISVERIKDELEKIILSTAPAKGVELLHETGLLQYIIPEIEVGVDVTQSHHHYYGPYNTVYKHLVASLEKCPSDKLEVRLAALLHDVGKPKTKRGEGENATFYNHEYAGAKIAERILERLKFSRKVIDRVVLLVKNHMFYYNVDEVGEAGVRRVVRKVGLENINDLIDVRIADRLGSGVPKAVPYKLRHFKFMVEKVSSDAVSVKQLKINGNDLMKELKLAPGPKIGAILDVLLSEVIENSELNEKEKLLERAAELEKREIGEIRGIAKKKIKEENEREEEYMKKKYWVE